MRGVLVMGEKYKIMVVDDKKSTVQLFESMLKPSGYDVLKAYSGEEALSLLKTHTPDLMLLDVMMPGINGFEVLKRVKGSSKYNFIPVVLVTTLISKEDRITGLELGADDFLSIPVNKSVLLARTRSLLRIKYLYDRLHQSYEDLKQLEDTKEMLTYMIVHDLSNPLQGITGLVDVIGKKFPETRDYVKSALEEINRLQFLISNILTINKLEEGKMVLDLSTFHIGELLEQLQKQYEGKAGLRSAKIVCDIDEKVPAVAADKMIICRTIENLLTNALRSIKKGGEVIFKAVPNNKEGVVEVRVIDNGYGIPSGYLDKIFDKFEQVKIRKSGEKYDSGLGLTFCKLAVEAHGGKIWVESEVDKGSTFAFTIPVSKS